MAASCRTSMRTPVLVAPHGVDLLEVTLTDMIECLLGICSACAHAETTVRKRHHRRWLLLQRSQRGHARLSALKSAQRYRPTFVRQVAMEDGSLPTVTQCGAVGIVKDHGRVLYYSMHLRFSFSVLRVCFSAPFLFRGCNCLPLVSLSIAFQQNA